MADVSLVSPPDIPASACDKELEDERDPLFHNGMIWHGHNLKLAHAYGIYPSAIRGAVIALGDDAFIFCVGRHIAIYDHVHHKLNFLQHDTRLKSVTAAAKSPDGKLLAVAERQGGEEGIVQISVLGLPKVDGVPAGGSIDDSIGSRAEKENKEALKVLHPPNKRLDITDLAFTADGKFVVSLSAMPESTIIYWRWEIGKVVASHNIMLPVTRLQVNPRNGCNLSVSGPRYLRLWEYNSISHQLQESPSMFPLKQEKSMNVVDHCWVLSAFLCAATEDGHVHLFEDGEHKQDVDVRAIITKDEATGTKAVEREQARKLEKEGMSSGFYKEPTPVRLQSLAVWSRGFVVGGDQGYLGVFRVDAKLQVESFGTFRIPGDDATVWQMCSGSEDTHLTILSYTEQEIEDDVELTKAPRSAKSRGTMQRGAATKSDASMMSSPLEPKYEKVWSLKTFPVGQADLAATGQLEVFVPVFPHSTHHGPITSMASAGCRRIAATAGSDMMLRVWGYPSEGQQDQPGCFTTELSFPVSTYEKPRSIAVHPMGFQVAVVLDDMIRVYHLATQQVIRTLFDLPLKQSGDVAYSTAGHMLAVTSGNDVILLDPWRSTLIHMFSGHGGHLSNVSQVLFSEDDALLLSCSEKPHGAIYGWDLETETKDKSFEHISKGTGYACIAHDLKLGLVVACTRPDGDTPGNLRVTGHLTSTMQEILGDGKGAGYTTLRLAAALGALFAGTEHGAVRIFRWPLICSDSNQYIECSLHAHSITGLTLSYDLRYLFSTCKGGAVMACSIHSYKEGEVVKMTEEQLHEKYVTYRHRQDSEKKRKSTREDERKIRELQKKLGAAGQVVSATTASMDELVVVPKVYFNERLAEIQELEERMANQQNENDYAMEQKDQDVQEKLNMAHNQMKQQQQRSEEKYKDLFNTLRRTQDQHETSMAQASSHFDGRHRGLQAEFDDRISKEYDKQSRLLTELQSLREQHEADDRTVEAKHEDQLADLRRTQEKAMREWRAEYDKVCNLLKSDGLKFEEALRQQESEYEAQISEMLEHKRVALQVESEKSTTALKDGVSMKQTISMLQGQLKEKAEELRRVQQERDDLQNKLKGSQEMFAKVKEQLNERERGLKVKDESLQNLREQMKHLESFRFVLFHKVKVLEEERNPLEEQVNMLKTNVGEMYNEFVREFRQKQQLDQSLTDKAYLAGSLQVENVKLRSSLAQLKKDGRRLIQEVEQVLHADTTAAFEKMPKTLQAVLQKHQNLHQWAMPAGEEATPEAEASPPDVRKESSIIEEMVIQRDLLFRKNQIAVGAANQAKRECAADVRRLTAENAQLIAEMNTLRDERKTWQRNCKDLESDLMAFAAANKRSARDTGKGGANGTEGSGGGMSRIASAPEFARAGVGRGDGSPGGRRPRQGSGGGIAAAVADTPYMRRKVVDQQEVFRRQKQKQQNQLPPVNQPTPSDMGKPPLSGGGKRLSASGKWTPEERRFSQTLANLQAGRSQMEGQGFDMSNLSNAAREDVNRRPGSGTDLPLEGVPSSPLTKDSASNGGGIADESSFPVADGIQES